MKEATFNKLWAARDRISSCKTWIEKIKPNEMSKEDIKTLKRMVNTLTRLNGTLSDMLRNTAVHEKPYEHTRGC